MPLPLQEDAPARPDPDVRGAIPHDPLGEALSLARTLRAFDEGNGEVALGAYQVESMVGSGGFGTVYRGRQPSVGGRLVAIKLLRPGIVADRGGVDRLRREALALASLDHPNVVAVHDVQDSEFGAFMVMDFIEGESFARWTSRPRAWSEIVDGWLQVGRALAAAHDRGILHLDVKPANAMRSPDGRVRVLDFGLAGGPGIQRAAVTVEDCTAPRTSSATVTLASGGTHGYAAPEQVRGARVTPHADQFSFCASLWQMLYGVLPYTPEEIRRLGDGGLRQPSPHTGERRGPRAIEIALRRGLAAHPHDRWPEMSDLLDVLGRPAILRRPTTWGVIGGCVVATPMLVRAALHDEDVCADPNAELRGIWDDDRHTAFAEAVKLSSAPYAPSLAVSVTRVLDERAAAWAEESRAACTHAVARAAFGSAQHVVKTACLGRYREQLASVTSLLIEGEVTTLERAPDLLAELGSPEDCDEPSIRMRPSVRIDIEPRLREIQTGRIVLAAGRTDDALAQSEALLQSPESDDPRVAGAAHLFRGMVLDQVGRDIAARDEFLEAVASALEAGDETTAAEGWRRLTWLAADDLDDIPHALEWNRMGMAVLEHLGRPPRLVAEQHDALGRVEYLRRDPAAAEREHEAALAELQRVVAPDDLRLATTLVGLAHAKAAAGDATKAASLYHRALDISTTQLGREHPRVADLWLSLALLDLDQGDITAAAERSREAERILVACCGDEAAGLAAVLTLRAKVATDQGKLDEAEALAERAWTIQQHLPQGHRDRGSALAVLVNIALQRNDPERALHANLRLAEELRFQTRASDELAVTENNIGWYLCRLGRCAEAREHHERVLALDGVDAWQRLNATSGLAGVALDQGTPELARSLLETSLRNALAQDHDDEAIRAEISWRLALALDQLKVDPARALSLAAAARPGFEALGDAKVLAEIDDFLNTRPPATPGTRRQ